MMSKWDVYLIRVLRSDIDAKESELEALRHSLRYRVGGWVIESWPPGRRTMVIVARIFAVFLKLSWRKNAIGRGKRVQSCQADAIAEGEFVQLVIFGTQANAESLGRDAFCSDDPVALIQLLDRERPPGTLVVRRTNEAIVRRISRLRLNGWKVVWQPEEGINEIDAHLVAYLESHADECVGSTS